MTEPHASAVRQAGRDGSTPSLPRRRDFGSRQRGLGNRRLHASFAAARVETDAVTLSLTKDEVGVLPPVMFGAGCARSSIEDRGGSTNKEGA